VMFGQTRAYSALMPSHFSSPASVSGLIASTRLQLRIGKGSRINTLLARQGTAE
jgi:hypothetical protein